MRLPQPSISLLGSYSASQTRGVSEPVSHYQGQGHKVARFAVDAPLEDYQNLANSKQLPTLDKEAEDVAQLMWARNSRGSV